VCMRTTPPGNLFGFIRFCSVFCLETRIARIVAEARSSEKWDIVKNCRRKSLVQRSWFRTGFEFVPFCLVLYSIERCVSSISIPEKRYQFVPHP
jgi:hypothetical protein